MTTESTHQVRDGDRILEFTGELLAESTSQRRGNNRWIEFELYRTRAGDYVLARIGCSVVFHAPGCGLVSQYRLKIGEIHPQATPCENCSPGRNEDVLYPEKMRYWAQVMKQPSAVLEALYKWDAEGAKYLTHVAQRLLEEAADADPRIAEAYRIEHIA